MSQTDQFWHYAKEAMLAAPYAKTGQDMQGLLDFAATRTQAALQERQSFNQSQQVAWGQCRVRPRQPAVLQSCPIFSAIYKASRNQF